MAISIAINDTPTGCVAIVTDGIDELNDEQVTMRGFLRWYARGSLIAEGRSCKCDVGTAVECRLEG